TFVTLGQAATHTSRLGLFPAVTNPFTRHPSVLASAIQTVEERSPRSKRTRQSRVAARISARRNFWTLPVLVSGRPSRAITRICCGTL
ncbi:MAG: LLM class flavin-dependent oxidoreductase, partial [Candidatus Rokuibacteriota bacterium]